MSTHITVLLATYKRYDSTLPICLMSIINQTRKPDRIILIDDNKEKNFYDYNYLKNIISICKTKNIIFDYFYGESKGATLALQVGLQKIKNGWVLKLDDDNCLEPNVIEFFENAIQDKVGAIGGMIIDKNIRQNIEKNLFPKCVNNYYNKIENIFFEFNIQNILDQTEEIKKVEHLYSNYFFRRDLIESFPIELSPSCHREDTIVTHSIFRKGFDLIVVPKAKTYHLSSDKNSGDGNWDYLINKNELIFIKYMEEWGVIPNKVQIIKKGKEIFAKRNTELFAITK